MQIITSLNGKMTTRTALTCVVASGAPITIEKNDSYRFLGLAIINLRIRVTGSYAESQIVINGFPAQYGATLSPGSSAMTMASNKKRFSMDEYGQIIAVESLSSSDGAITLSGVYVTNI